MNRLYLLTKFKKLTILYLILLVLLTSQIQPSQGFNSEHVTDENGIETYFWVYSRPSNPDKIPFDTEVKLTIRFASYSFYEDPEGVNGITQLSNITLSFWVIFSDNQVTSEINQSGEDIISPEQYSLFEYYFDSPLSILPNRAENATLVANVEYDTILGHSTTRNMTIGTFLFRDPEPVDNSGSFDRYGRYLLVFILVPIFKGVQRAKRS